ncbi:MAG: radical SAM/SPASM domain-containing protein [Candidatus Pacearchaeota archaeon]|jgi:radical SAM protein with 4Fe4S-binding SPASM domain
MVNLIKKIIFTKYLNLKGILDFPKTVLIETTNICPLNCITCPRIFMKRKIGIMNFDLFKKIINELKTKKINHITFHLFGEPLAKPDLLFRMLDYTHKKMPKTTLSFSENCVLLNKENSKKILESPLNEITLSLDGATKKTYEKIRVNSNFEKITKNVEEFLKLKKQSNSKLKATLQIIKMNETAKEIDLFRKKWKPLLGKNDKILAKEFTTFGGIVKDRSIKSLKRKIKRYIRNSLPCLALWSGINIQWNGDVVICCMDCEGQTKIGNCKKNTLKEIINGKKMQNLRKMNLNLELKKLPLCKGCYNSF